MHVKYFETINGEMLMSASPEPINFIVDTLLSQGLHLLAGASKVGKSWLALWLGVTVAKGEPVWGMPVRKGTTLYLCLEDSIIRIQNRLFEITEDAPPNVHFTTNAFTIGDGLEEQIESFIREYPDTVLIIIDTLQMIRNPAYDATYTKDYKELTVLKKLADKYKIAILLIHHLRKEDSKDTFNRISGTMAIQGSVDSSFTLVEEKRGSRKALLSCVGRDIEYRELELKCNDDNVWEVVSDSYRQQEVLQDKTIFLLSEFMKLHNHFIGTPTELSQEINQLCTETISSKILSKRLIQNQAELSSMGISFQSKRSNGKRLIELHKTSEDSADKIKTAIVPKIIGPVDPVSKINENRDESSSCSSAKKMLDRNSADSDDKIGTATVPKIIDPVDPVSKINENRDESSSCSSKRKMIDRNSADSDVEIGTATVPEIIGTVDPASEVSLIT